MDGLPPELAQVIERVRARDPEAGTLFERVALAADALAWARERLSALVAPRSERDMLEVLVEEAAQLTGAPEVWALTWTGDAASGKASFRALAGRGAIGRTEHGTITPDGLSRSIVGEVAQTLRPAWSDDAIADSRFHGARSVQALAIRSVGCVPIGPRGVLYLCDPSTPARFGPVARARLAALGALAGALRSEGAESSAARRRPRAEPLPGIVGESPPMLELAATVRAFAPMPWPVLVLGETGTGKELVARAIHELSGRARGPFVAVNCAALPEELAESTLFGHERGSFTGAERTRAGLVERAAEGTLFLDEVGELPTRIQPKLLRLLQEGRYERVGDDRERPFRARVVAATHRAIDAGIGPEGARDAEASFRSDLFHRLSACIVRVPSLRERREDLPLLAQHLLAVAVREIPQGASLELDQTALAEIERREWPGNVRELQNTLRSALARALAEGAGQVRAEHLAPARRDEPVLALPNDLAAATEAFQREHVRAALRSCDGSKSAAAARLGVSRQWLHKLVARWEREGSW